MMGKLFKSLAKDIKQTAWDQPMGTLEDLAHGDLKGVGDNLQHVLGDNERSQSDILNSVGIKGWIGDHPQESALAVAGTILGGWAAAGAGAGAAGAGTAASTGAAGSGALASGTAATTAGGSLFSAPIGYAAGSGTTGIGAGTVGATPFAVTGGSVAYAPTASTVLGGSGATTLGSGATIGSEGLSVGAGSSSLGVGSSPFTYEGSSLAYSPTESALYTTNPAETTPASSFDIDTLNQIMKQLQSTNSGDSSQQQQAPQAQHSQPQAFNGKYASQYGKPVNNGSPISNNPFMNGI